MAESGIGELSVACPYCGEEFSTSVDFSGGAQEYYEDCQVCCQPIVFSIEEEIGSDESNVMVRRDDG